MKHLIPCLLFLFFACQPDPKEATGTQTGAPVSGNSLYKSGQEIDTSLSESGEGIFSDGRYEAKVNYHNPNTGKKTDYTLTVEVQNNQVIKICFSNGGWLDTDHFTAATLNKGGLTSFVSDKGYHYTVAVATLLQQEEDK